MDEPRVTRTWARASRRPPKFTDWLGDKVLAPPVTIGQAVVTVVVLIVGLLARKVVPLPLPVVIVVAVLLGYAYLALQEAQLGSPQLYGLSGLIRANQRAHVALARFRSAPKPRGHTRVDIPAGVERQVWKAALAEVDAIAEEALRED